MFHCFDHEIVLEGMKEEISQQRGTIGAHWYTNNLLENRAPKTNVDVVDKKVNSETKLSTREVCVPHGRIKKWPIVVCPIRFHNFKQ